MAQCSSEHLQITEGTVPLPTAAADWLDHLTNSSYPVDVKTACGSSNIDRKIHDKQCQILMQAREPSPLTTNANSCRHLEYARPGGRAERRVGDLVRRRKWMMPESRDRSSGQNSTAQNVARATSKVAHSLISPVTQMQGSK